MAKQTLSQAIHVAYSAKSRELARAISFLDGCPVGGWGETTQARTMIAGALPLRGERRYTIEQFIVSAYSVDHADRYRTRAESDARQCAATIEAEASVAQLDRVRR
jgi:hypothetical protein